MGIANPGSTPSPYKDLAQQVNEPAFDFFAITPSDTVDLTTRPRAIYVGGTGNIVMKNNSGVSVTFNNVQAGSILSVSPTRVMNTNTTATGLVALI